MTISAKSTPLAAVNLVKNAVSTSPKATHTEKGLNLINNHGNELFIEFGLDTITVYINKALFKEYSATGLNNTIDINSFVKKTLKDIYDIKAS
ncbi:TPA: hypothetical protein ACGIK9_003308 [Acinetobacter baumannii]|uniref:hypothetical protein n=1 Tax=Acinetobacter baumannii TaxID=470 RepID=UPI00338D9273